MNFIKRSCLSVKARIGKSILLLIIFAVIFVLVVSGLAIQDATQKSANFARQSLGNEIDFRYDFENLIEKIQNGELDESKLMEGDLETINAEDVENLAAHPNIIGYNLHSSARVKPESFKLVESMESSRNERLDELTDTATLLGWTYTENAINFKSGENTLIEGRHLTEEDVNKDVALIEKQLAEENNLTVGDHLTVSSNNKQSKLEVVGIYEAKPSKDSIYAQFPFLIPNNDIYTPTEVTNSLSNKENNTAELATLFIDDPLHIDDFIAWANEEFKDVMEEYNLDANDMIFQQAIGPIQNVASLARNIVYMIIIAGTLILGLIIMMSIRERKYEMGVLLSIGEKKWKIVGQLLTEVLIVMILALGFSAASSNVIANEVGARLLENQVQNAGSENVSQMGFFFGPQMDVIDEINVAVTLKELGVMTVVGILIAIMTTIMPTLSILKLQPKTILTKQD